MNSTAGLTPIFIKILPVLLPGRIALGYPIYWSRSSEFQRGEEEVRLGNSRYSFGCMVTRQGLKFYVHISSLFSGCVFTSISLLFFIFITSRSTSTNIEGILYNCFQLARSKDYTTVQLSGKIILTRRGNSLHNHSLFKQTPKKPAMNWIPIYKSRLLQRHLIAEPIFEKDLRYWSIVCDLIKERKMWKYKPTVNSESQILQLLLLVNTAHYSYNYKTLHQLLQHRQA